MSLCKGFSSPNASEYVLKAMHDISVASFYGPMFYNHYIQEGLHMTLVTNSTLWYCLVFHGL